MSTNIDDMKYEEGRQRGDYIIMIRKEKENIVVSLKEQQKKIHFFVCLEDIPLSM